MAEGGALAFEARFALVLAFCLAFGGRVSGAGRVAVR